MQTFHNDPTIKQKYLDRVIAHEKADEIIKGVYWQNGKGCAVGCSIHSNHHKGYETELGIPEILAHIEDQIFENLPNELAKTWPRRFLEIIPIGVNLNPVWAKFAHWLIMDEHDGVIRFNDHESIKQVASLFQRQIAGDFPSVDEWYHAAYTAIAVTGIPASYATAAPAAPAAPAAAARYAAAAARYSAARCTAAAAAATRYDALKYAADDEDAAEDAADAATAAIRYAAAATGYDALKYAADDEDAAEDAADAATAAIRYAATAIYVVADAYDASIEDPYIRQSEKILELLRLA